MKKKRKKKVKLLPARNLIALNPLMRKSCVHEKPEKVKRLSNKHTLKKELNTLLSFLP
jgi:hypothetical protein